MSLVYEKLIISSNTRTLSLHQKSSFPCSPDAHADIVGATAASVVSLLVEFSLFRSVLFASPVPGSNSTASPSAEIPPNEERDSLTSLRTKTLSAALFLRNKKSANGVNFTWLLEQLDKEPLPLHLGEFLHGARVLWEESEEMFDIVFFWSRNTNAVWTKPMNDIIGFVSFVALSSLELRNKFSGENKTWAESEVAAARNVFSNLILFEWRGPMIQHHMQIFAEFRLDRPTELPKRVAQSTSRIQSLGSDAVRRLRRADVMRIALCAERTCNFDVVDFLVSFAEEELKEERRALEIMVERSQTSAEYAASTSSDSAGSGGMPEHLRETSLCTVFIALSNIGPRGGSASRKLVVALEEYTYCGNIEFHLMNWGLSARESELRNADRIALYCVGLSAQCALYFCSAAEPVVQISEVVRNLHTLLDCMYREEASQEHAEIAKSGINTLVRARLLSRVFDILSLCEWKEEERNFYDQSFCWPNNDPDHLLGEVLRWSPPPQGSSDATPALPIFAAIEQAETSRSVVEEHAQSEKNTASQFSIVVRERMEDVLRSQPYCAGTLEEMSTAQQEQSPRRGTEEEGQTLSLVALLQRTLSEVPAPTLPVHRHKNYTYGHFLMFARTPWENRDTVHWRSLRQQANLVIARENTRVREDPSWAIRWDAEESPQPHDFPPWEDLFDECDEKFFEQHATACEALQPSAQGVRIKANDLPAIARMVAAHLIHSGINTGIKCVRYLHFPIFLPPNGLVFRGLSPRHGDALAKMSIRDVVQHGIRCVDWRHSCAEGQTWARGGQFFTSPSLPSAGFYATHWDGPFRALVAVNAEYANRAISHSGRGRWAVEGSGLQAIFYDPVPPSAIEFVVATRECFPEKSGDETEEAAPRSLQDAEVPVVFPQEIVVLSEQGEHRNDNDGRRLETLLERATVEADGRRKGVLTREDIYNETMRVYSRMVVGDEVGWEADGGANS